MKTRDKRQEEGQVGERMRREVWFGGIKWNLAFFMPQLVQHLDTTSTHILIHKFFYFSYENHHLSLVIISRKKMDTEVESNPEPLFRPVKKRKFLRRRPDHEQEDSQESATEIKDASSRNTQNPPAHTTEETDDVVRLRRPQRTRKGGIEFSTTSRQTTNSGSQAVTAPPNPEETEDDRILAMCDRFTAHTGQTVDVDKHMYGPLPPRVPRR